MGSSHFVEEDEECLISDHLGPEVSAYLLAPVAHIVTAGRNHEVLHL